ncbi:MAG: DUF1036 domain-containing protein [Candidatus Hydrogenedentes bacterium]|nr:DUF1036 domain-containing protein [Candidatus Hydrogenedentota bacterium]
MNKPMYFYTVIFIMFLYPEVVWSEPPSEKAVIGELSIINIAPYTISASTAYQNENGRWEMHGWYNLEPGEYIEHRRQLYAENPSIYVFASSSDIDAVGWCHDVPEGSKAELEWPGAAEPVAFEAWMRNIKHGVSASTLHGLQRCLALGEPGEDSRIVRFAPAVLTEDIEIGLSQVTRRFSYIVYDPTMNISKPLITSPQELSEAMQYAQLLGDSLARQVAHDADWKDKEDFPYLLGIVLSDSNDWHELGVEVVEAPTQTWDEKPMQIKAGDLLVQLSGRPVFSRRDVRLLLREHAEDIERGIEKPISFVVHRGDKSVKGMTTYWFHPMYFTPYSEGGSFILGLFDSITFSQSDKIGGFLSTLFFAADEGAETRWDIAQRIAIEKQHNRDDFNAGSFGGMFVNPTRGAVKAVAGKSGAKFLSSTAGRVAFEVVEGMVWTIGDGTPMRSRSDLTSEIVANIPYSIGGGLAQGALRSISR